MLVFCDYHHNALARSMFYLFADRLGFSLHFPSIQFAESVDPSGSIIGRMAEAWTEAVGGIEQSVWDKHCRLVGLEEFLDTDYDIVLMTRTETQQLLLPLIRRKWKWKFHRSRPKLIALSGNENSVYDWEKIQNLMATDEQTYMLAPDRVHKIWTVQEIGRQYQNIPFNPVDSQSLKRVGAFINCLPTFPNAFVWNYDKYDGRCPHCESAERRFARPVNVPMLWCNMADRLSELGYECVPHGAGNESFGGSNVSERDLPRVIQGFSLIWHFKSHEGWGHSLIQSLYCGRPILIPRRFYRYRSAGKCLIPDVNCFECDWNESSIVSKILEVTTDLKTINRYAELAYKTVRSIFSWEHEAWRVSRWLENLR